MSDLPDWHKGIAYVLQEIPVRNEAEFGTWKGYDKEFYVEKTVRAGTTWAGNIYHVPSDKQLLIFDIMFAVYASSNYVFVVKYYAAEFYRFFGCYNQLCGRAMYFKPIVLPPDAYLRLELWNGDSADRTFYIYIGGVEVEV